MTPQGSERKTITYGNPDEGMLEGRKFVGCGEE